MAPHGRARRATRLAAGLATVLAAAGCGGHTAGPRHVTLAIRAPSGLSDAPVTVDVRGLRPHERVTLRGRRIAFDRHAWSSAVPLRAGADGTIRLRGFAAGRFLWSMQPVGPRFRDPFFFAPVRGRDDVAVTLTDGRRTLARTSVSRRITPPGVRVRRLTLDRDGVDGYLCLPPGTARRSAVLAFGGSEGGNAMLDAAGVLAAHGHPALSLAYFGEPGLPKELVNVPLEYFARAVRRLRREPSVDPAHVFAMGDSRGGEAALLIAATFPTLIHGAIGLVPSATVYPAPAAELRAWTLHGRALPLETIPVERITGPVLTAGAGDDRVWASGPSVERIERRLRAHHFRFAHDGVVYRASGHLIGSTLPYLPAPTADDGFGGSQRVDAAAVADLWPRILRLIDGRAGA